MAQIDINDFDAIRIGLASPKQIRDWSMGEVTKPETINYRTLKPERDGLFCERIFGPTKDWECYCGKYKRVRYKGIICERCGVEVTRQKVRRERMGHIDLAAPVSHIWFFKGVPSRIGYLLDIAPRELEKVLYFAASIVTGVDQEKRQADLVDLEDKVRAESEQIYVDRDEQLSALDERLARRRAFLAAGKDRGFDEDDEFWARGLSNWAEDQVLPGLEEARSLAGGIFPDLAKTVASEDPKRLRELVRQTATRDDRRLAPREIESVATAAVEIRAALEPLRDELDKASGAKKGAITKHLHKVLDLLLTGGELSGDDAELVASVDAKNLDRAREVGNGLLRAVLEQADADAETEQVRELAYDLCLVEGARKEDLEAVQQWATKVKEMVTDIESRREDTREAAVEGVRRLEETWKLFRELSVKQVVNDEQLFRELKDRFGSPYGFGVYFRGGMGAESIRELLRDLDLQEESLTLRDTIKTSKGQKQQRAIKRLKVVQAFITSENKPEWMVLEAVPVIPPELRPMVQLDGGRFATSDLNDLYRRVINRNNRLKRLLDLGAPEIIVNNEKRMLQEAVDALFDNGRRGRAVTGPGNRPLKSLSDMLKGKQGRFRQNLLGKRVDYSGRSVIVAGPNLKLHQCGLPKLMALELFKPFIMSRLVERKSVQNIKAAKKHVESMVPEVWDVLEEVIAEHPVLLNRAPTLHRLGIQAFEPVLVEGKAIQVHPLVCHAFNADFDGDQMAVHLPLSAEAQAEARILMLSSNNILSPAHGRPLATPTQDMVLGAYYLTYCPHDLAATTAEALAKELKLKGLPRFSTEEQVEFALDAKQVTLQQPVEFRRGEEIRLTTPGRVIFESELERSLVDAVTDGQPVTLVVDRALTKRELDALIDRLVGDYGAYAVATVLDTIKSLAFRYATRAGITVSKNDIVIPPSKEEILSGYEEQVAKVEREYERGLMTEEERKERVVAVWTEATDKVADAMKANLLPTNSIFMMANSGARGSFNQIRQLAGMRGLMANPKGEIIERPIKANFMEGLSVLEYFISTHGARKGLADTALRTADSGYLTRRLVDVSQDVIIREEDCGTEDHVELPVLLDGQPNLSAAGRVLATDVHKPLKDGKPGQDGPRREGRAPHEAAAARGDRAARGGDRLRPAGADGAQVPQRGRRVPRLLRDVPRHGRHVRDRRRRRHRRGAVDRRAGHPAHDAHVPHGRRRGRGHHARPAARRRDLRGAEPEGRRDARRGRRQGVGRGAGADGARHRHAERARRERRAAPGQGVLVPEPHAAPRPDGRRRHAGRPAQRGLGQPGRHARAAHACDAGLDPDRAVPRRRGAEGLQVAGRRHPRQAHRAHRPPDDEEGARRDARLDRAPARSARGQGRARARQRGRPVGEGRRGGDLRAAHPRDHQGLARDRVVPLRRLLPGDDEGAHRRLDRGQGRPPARAQGERDHREADPGGHGSQEVPRHRHRAVRAAARRDVRRRHGRRPARCARGDRRRRRRPRSRLARPRLRGPGSRTSRSCPRRPTTRGVRARNRVPVVGPVAGPTTGEQPGRRARGRTRPPPRSTAAPPGDAARLDLREHAERLRATRTGQHDRVRARPDGVDRGGTELPEDVGHLPGGRVRLPDDRHREPGVRLGGPRHLRLERVEERDPARHGARHPASVRRR